MGYAGYVPAKLPPAKLTGAEAALAAIKSQDALEIIGKLLYNCAVAPKDEKFRKIKLSNKKITENVVNATGAMDAMKELGWVVSEENSDELVIPEGVYFTMKEVRMVEDAKDRLKKDMRSNSSKNLAGMVSVKA